MPDKLTPRQNIGLQKLLAGETVLSAAQASGVRRETLYAWMAKPAFQAELQKAEAEALSSLSRGLLDVGSKAIDVLLDALNDASDKHASTRVRAADIVLGRILQMRELYVLESRVRALEEALLEARKK